MTKTVLGRCIRPGDACVDATMGNGHDTLFLAQAVGPQGTVYAFDIQSDALRKTAGRLAEAGTADWVRLIEDGHENAGSHIDPAHAGSLAAVTFNFGYLPGSDKSVVTRPETSLRALETLLAMLRPGGIASLTLYTGHPGGQDEADALLDFCRSLDFRTFPVSRYEFVNKPGPVKTLLLIQRSDGSHRLG